MMSSNVPGFVRCVLACVLLTASPSALPAQSPDEDARLTEARLAFEATEYERARELLDALIDATSGQEDDPQQRRMLVSSYDLRGRVLTNLGDFDAARVDFGRLLRLEPGYVISAQAGRSSEVFAEAQAQTLGWLTITVEPADATVTIDGEPFTKLGEAVPVLANRDYTVRASREGYAPFTSRPGIQPNDSQQIAIALIRVSSTITVMTLPPEVEVVVDGVARGITIADPQAVSSAPGQPGASRRFSVLDVPVGVRRVELRRECYTPQTIEVSVPAPGDYDLEPVRLQPAVASVRVDANVSGGVVFVDEESRGPAPFAGDVCHGSHTIEVRTGWGRDLQRVDLKTGQDLSFTGRVRPAFAIVSDSGATRDQLENARDDLRLETEIEFRDTQTVALFASPERRTTELLAVNQLPETWLAFDTLGRPLGDAGKISNSARQRYGAQIAQTLNAQGLAAIAPAPDGDQSDDMLLILLAPGSAKPDVLRWRRRDPASVRDTIARLDASPPILRTSLGLLAIDVLDVDGAVVAMVERDSGAAGAGIQVGEVIARAAGTPVRDAVHLQSIVGEHAQAQTLALEVREANGTSRMVDVTLRQVPRVVEPLDQTLLFNKLAVELSARASASPSPLEEVALRFNLVVAHLRLERWEDARAELDLIEGLLSKNAGVAGWATDAAFGTIWYLRGWALEELNDGPGAERAWLEAAKSRGNLLTDSAEPISSAAERRLAELRRVRGTGR